MGPAVRGLEALDGIMTEHKIKASVQESRDPTRRSRLNSSPRTDPGKIRVVSGAAAVLCVCLPTTLAAYLVFPFWDDSSLWLLFREKGLDALAAGHADRPLNAAMWSILLAHSEALFWRTAFLAQATLWPLLAVLSALLWKLCFPNLSRYSAVVACLAVSPIVVKVQMMTANMALQGFLSVILAYGGILLGARYVLSGSQVAWGSLATGLMLVVLAVLQTSYGMATSLAGVLLLGGSFLCFPERASKVRSITAGASMALVAGASYVTFVYLGDLGTTRPPADPSYSLKVLQDDLLFLPFRMASAVWYCLGGAMAKALGGVAFFDRASVAAAAYGTVVAILLALACQRGEPQRPTSPEHASMRLGGFALFLVALLAALAPVVAMGRTPWEGETQSRFFIPVLPLVGVLAVGGGLAVFRSRYFPAAIVLVGFVAGQVAFSDAWSAIRERRIMASVGEVLRSHVESEDRISVAIVSFPDRPHGPRRPWEVTARIAYAWPEPLRRRFWAFDSTQEASSKGEFGSRGNCSTPREVDFAIRGVERRGSLGQVIWVVPDHHAPLRDVLNQEVDVVVEPYCVRAQGNGGLVLE